MFVKDTSYSTGVKHSSKAVSVSCEHKMRILIYIMLTLGEKNCPLPPPVKKERKETRTHNTTKKRDGKERRRGQYTVTQVVTQMHAYSCTVWFHSKHVHD